MPWLDVDPARLVFGMILLLACAWLLTSNAAAQEQEQSDRSNEAPARPADKIDMATARVGVYVSEPFVMKTVGGYTGMAIELWDSIAKNHDVTTTYVEYPTFASLIAATETGEVDVAVTNLTITEERAIRVDFTHPWFDGGLQILIDDDRGTGLSAILGELGNSGHLKALLWLIGTIVFASVTLTLFDRRFDKDFPEKWPEGFAESFYSVMSIATSGKSPSRKNLFGWPGRIWSAFWLVCGIAVLAFVTSAVTSVMTTLALENRITGLNDLPGRSVGVLSGSTAEEFIISSGYRSVEFDNIDEAVEGLVAGRVDVIVGDAPVLSYFAHTREERDISVVGPIFEPDKYGFALQRGSPHRKPLSIDLLGAAEDGVIEKLNLKYFGVAQ